jgi:ADP-dependent NAD(P)H-hydrate dehydratase / NAD(P)H-hydrate epimerase
LVDGLFGTGLSRPLDPQVIAQISRLSQSSALLIAIDLPSGVDTDSGAHLGANQADMTLALGALKPAHLAQPGAQYCGHIKVADIGVEAMSDLSVLAQPKLNAPGFDSHKYARGYAAIVGGAMGGAAMLSAKAAMPAAGYVALIGANRIGPDALVHRRWSEVAEDRRVGALLIGPGLGRGDKAKAALAAALATSHPLVLDADALILSNAAALKSRGLPLILTPHEGEFSALFPGPSGSKVERARTAALASGAVIILKGADTVIAAPDGRACIAAYAPTWLASAGTGDVLAGIVTALLSSGLDPFEAACAAVWLHNEAARLAGPALIADHLITHLPAAIGSCL